MAEEVHDGIGGLRTTPAESGDSADSLDNNVNDTTTDPETAGDEADKGQAADTDA
ncbi:hypothetical protein ACFU99_19740 [Streptomyces sp. NPDC057654]|uniref:hypothetical protein n=1 Tax=Streptomyces sp. NPDC057654 TaxID=3346196 RepID=UPI0036C17AE6